MPQEILTLGSNGSYQLGLGHDNDVSIPENIPFTDPVDNNIHQIVSGGNHTLFITEDGGVFGSGNNNHGQLSYLISDKLIKVPTRLSLLRNDKCSLAAAGWEFSIFVTTTNKVLSCGNGPKGELGTGLSVTASPPPGIHQLTNFPPEGTKILQIAAGLAHVVVLLDNNTLWGWGSSRKGQIGELNSSQKICPEPVLAFQNEDISDPITHISCGREFTVIGFANSGKIEVLGGDKWGFERHMRIPGTTFKSIDSGWSTIHCLSTDGINITSWGNNSHFQHNPPALSDYNLQFDQLIDGSEHSVVVTKDHKNVYAWGWGEHGNCGSDGFDDNDKLYKLYSTIGSEKIIKNVFCGHASTWIVIDYNI